MRTLFWILFFVGGYIWLVTSGNEQAVISQGKKLYHSFTEMFEDTEIDFHFKKMPSKSKKKSRRWD